MMTSNGKDPKDGSDAKPVLVLVTGAVIYGLMATGALFWLWSRDRLDALPARAIGEYGPLAASGIGLAVGVVAAWILNRSLDRFAGLKEIASEAQKLFARAGDGIAITFVLISAIAEELFFRLAVQDLFGLFGAVAVYVLLNSSVGGWRWVVFTFFHSLVLGLIVHLGFGLLGSTTAHAILNYLSLRRVQDS